MSEPLTGYEATSVVDVESFLDDNPAASSDEVYLGTVGHSERAIAAVAAKRAGGGGGGGGSPFNGGTITETLEIDVPAATNGLIVKVNGRQMLKVGSNGAVTLQAEPGHNAGELVLGADDTVTLAGAGNSFILIAADDSISFGSGETIEITADGSLAIESLLEEPPTTVANSMIPWYDSKSLVDPSLALTINFAAPFVWSNQTHISPAFSSPSAGAAWSARPLTAPSSRANWP